MNKRTIITIVSIALIIILAIILIGGGRSDLKKESPPLHADTSGLSKEIPVSAQVIQPAEFKEIIPANSVLEGWHRTYLSSQSGGRVENWNAELGMELSEGDTLVLFDSETAELTYVQTQTQEEVARVALERAEKDLDRMKILYEHGDLSSLQVEDAELNLKNAKANFAASKAATGMASHAYSETFLTMPFNAHVTSRLVEVGQTVAPGTPVAEITQIDPLKMTVSLSESEIVRIRRGQSVYISVDMLEDSVFIGRVHAIGVAADAVTRLFKTEIIINNNDRILKPGMAASADIVVSDHKNVLVIPLNSVVGDGQTTGCFVVTGNKAFMQNITLGPLWHGDVLVSNGLNLGDTLVVKGQDGLKDGQSVKLNINNVM